MPDEITIKITGDKETKAAIDRLGQRLRPALVQSMRVVALYLSAYVKKQKLSGDPLSARSGRLRSSIHASVREHGNRIIGTIGTNLGYSRIHEFGGDITPKRAKYLTIPLDAAKTRAGVVRGPARSFQDTFFIRSKAGNIILMGKPTPAARDAEPLFVLKKFVSIPKRSYLESAVIENRKNIPDVFRETLKALAEQVKK